MQDILIARQPVFNRNFELSSYELKLRSKSDKQISTQLLVTTLMDAGLDKLSNGQLVHLSAPASCLLGDIEIISTLPAQGLGLILPENTAPNKQNIEAIKALKKLGFSITYEVTSYEDKQIPIIELSNIIKVNLSHVDNLAGEVRALRKHPVKILAASVDAHEQFEQIKTLNFDYTQGQFFIKPEIIEGRKIPESKLAILQALQKVLTAQAVSDVHKIIKQDLALSYRLLKHINSISFGMKIKVESIEQALALLGLSNIQRWLSLLSLSSLGEQKSPELMRSALIRGRFLENIARTRAESEGDDDFLLGMFSILDALLDMTMENALEGLVLPDSVRQGLLQPESKMGKKLAMCKALEQGDWKHVQEWSGSGKVLCITDLTRLNLEAMVWADAQVAELN